MSIIPDNNLPIYLQKYNVNILNTDIPKCLIGGCSGAQFGCCCDAITTKVDEEGTNCINGCCGTEFGCCPYSTEAKKDTAGSNCSSVVGSILYTIVGAMPSNMVEKRVWQLNLTGTLKPNVDTYYIVYDFSNVNYKDKVRFEDILNGTFNICGNILDASKYLNYKFCDTKSTLTIIINTRKWDFRLTKEVLFSYAININDVAGVDGGPTCNFIYSQINIECPSVDAVVNACQYAFFNTTYQWGVFCTNNDFPTYAFRNYISDPTSDSVYSLSRSFYYKDPKLGYIQIVFAIEDGIYISFLPNGSSGVSKGPVLSNTYWEYYNATLIIDDVESEESPTGPTYTINFSITETNS